MYPVWRPFRGGGGDTLLVRDQKCGKIIGMCGVSCGLSCRLRGARCQVHGKFTAGLQRNTAATAIHRNKHMLQCFQLGGIHKTVPGARKAACLQQAYSATQQLRSHTKQQRRTDVISYGHAKMFPAGWHSQDSFVKISVESATRARQKRHDPIFPCKVILA